MRALSLHDLAPREREALALTLSGKPQREVADLMGIQRANVAAYLGNARNKIGVRTTAELAAWALSFLAKPAPWKNRYAARFTPIPQRLHQHRRSCLCSVCFVKAQETRRWRR